MNLTARLKKWLIENAGIEPTASDATFKKAAGEKISSGELDPETLFALTKKVKASSDDDDEETENHQNFFKEAATALKGIQDLLSEDDVEDEDEVPHQKSVKKKKPPMLEDAEEFEEEDEEDEEEEPVKKPAKKGGISQLEKTVSNLHRGGFGDEDDTPDQGTQKSSFNIRIKKAVDQYDNTRKSLTFPEVTAKGRAHPMAGRPVMDYNEPGKGRLLDSSSERDKAIAGAFSKFLVNSAKLRSKSIAFTQLPQHDRELLLYAMENEKWGGSSDGGDYADIKDRRLTPREQKALIDDATSGGIEAAPIVFDDMVIQTPLLNGELYPLVNTVPLDRGRRVEGVAVGTVTGSWGGVDDTAIDLFDTTSYVTAFDTTIFRWQGAIRVGLDFLSDTPIDFGQTLTAQYGERLLEDLDDVIATGNGTDRPEGVMIKGGTTSISFGGTTTLGSYESLRFGVAKSEHKSMVASSAVFCGTETSYQRARAIPVGASDARRLGGGTATLGGITNYADYSWMGIPFKINESMANSQLFYAILARYRMYRRRGLTMRTSTEGDTLLRRNAMLMIGVARYGGQLERGACAAVTFTAEA